MGRAVLFSSSKGARNPHLRSRLTRTIGGLMLIGVLVLLVALGLTVTPTGSNSPVTAPRKPAPGPGPPLAAEAGLLPWQLNSPLSRSVVLPGSGGRLVVLGGLTAMDSSTDTVITIDTATGRTSNVGTLALAVHDAVGAVVGGHDVVFGGGSTATVGTVQTFDEPDSSPSTTPGPATILGRLPTPRSDAAAVAIGHTTYIVGGYDGSIPDSVVLATNDGRTFRSVASLPVPVRYPAVAALNGKLYVFGGEAVSGPSAGRPVDAVQVVDPAHRDAHVDGHLPEPLAGEVAVTLNHCIYVAGGESPVEQNQTPGLGTTQVTTTGSGATTATGSVAEGHSGSAGSGALTSTVSTIWAYDPTSGKLLVAGQLQVPVSHAGVAVIGQRAWIVGGESDGATSAVVQMLTPNGTYGTAGLAGAGSPFFGAKLLVADRGNNRLIVMDAAMRIDWAYPSPSSPPDPLGFYFPDDAFFVDKGTAIISNQEENETIVEIAYPSGKVIWSYGHPKHPGSVPGYLREPDDAYVLPTGQVSVADAQNCRVLVLNRNGTVAHQIGTTGRCVHDPPVSMGSPNGDTPLSDGDLLVSEINGSWVSEYTTSGDLVWTTQLPITYPSDPQQIGHDLYLIADYTKPGQILEFNRQGQIRYRYDVTSGPGMLDHPSLAEELPNGVIMLNDDDSDRMAAIDPTVDALVWQYGVTDHTGSDPGMLNTPDGFDILFPDGSTPTHIPTG